MSAPESAVTPPPTLRRQLRFVETAAVSVGVMAPTLAMSVTGVAAARELGRAASLAFVFAGLGVGLVAYGFVRLSREFSSAGSVYAFVGRALSPRWGFVTGWALLGTYLVFPPVSIMGVSVFARAFLESSGLAHDVDWYPLALIGWAVIGLFAVLGIRPTTRSLIVFEVVSVLLILILMGTILVRLGTGTPAVGGGGGLSARVLSLPPGTGLVTLTLAATSGFLAFAGFESAGSLGEESERPRQEIPRAIWVSVAFGALFYVSCMVLQSLGFGLDAAGVRGFVGSQAPLSDLAQHFVGWPLASALDVGAVLSAIGAGLGGVTVGARMIFAFARDGVVPRRLATVSPRARVPAAALAVEMLVGLLLLSAFRMAGSEPLDVFFYLATLGVLSLLVMYVVTNVAAVHRLVVTGSRWETLVPLAGTVVAGYVLYRNVWPLPPAPYRYFPYVVLAWLALAALATAVVPGLPARVSAGLARTRDRSSEQAG